MDITCCSIKHWLFAFQPVNYTSQHHRNPSRGWTGLLGSSHKNIPGQDTVVSTNMKRWAVPQVVMSGVTVCKDGTSDPRFGDPCRKLMYLGQTNSYDGDHHVQDITRWLEVEELRREACLFLIIFVPWHTTGTVLMLILLLLPVTEDTTLEVQVPFQRQKFTMEMKELAKEQKAISTWFSFLKVKTLEISINKF